MGKKRTLTTLFPTLPVLMAFYALFLLLSLRIEGFLPFEWAISFLPLILPVNIALMTANLLWWREKKQKNVIAFGSLILLSAVTVVLGIRFVDFAFIKPPKSNGAQQITIAFFNKNYPNTHYDDIEKAIRKVNPDIIGFTELEPQDIQHLSLLDSFPFKEYKTTSDRFTLGLYSKFPLTNTIVDPRLTHVLTATVDINDSLYRFYVAHPFPPILSKDIAARNTELAALGSIIQTSAANTVLIGDFNVTPWSPTYQQIFTTKHAMIKNAAKGKGLFFTWGWIPLVRAHIDHIFVPLTATVLSFDEVDVPGSDHHLIWTKVKL